MNNELERMFKEAVVARSKTASYGSAFKQVYKPYYSRGQSCCNVKCCRHIRQRALVRFDAYAQQEHSCGSSTWWPAWKIGLARQSEEVRAFCGHGKCPVFLAMVLFSSTTMPEQLPWRTNNSHEIHTSQYSLRSSWDSIWAHPKQKS
jgi:hypothetical protein